MREPRQTIAQMTKSTAVTEATLKHQAQELGLLGRLFGSASEKAGNIAGFAVVVAFAGAVIAAIWMPDTTSFTKKDAVLAFVGIITLALGFLFGRGSAPH